MKNNEEREGGEGTQSGGRAHLQENQPAFPERLHSAGVGSAGIRWQS